MSMFLTTEQPEARERVQRRERPAYYHRHELRQQATWLDWLIAFAVGSVVLACVAGFSGCVSTELTAGNVTISRTSVLSDVDVEASVSPDGTMRVRERQGQAVAERLVERVPAVTP